ncbi:MAG: AMP-binding protein [Anaerolineae bacterium]
MTITRTQADTLVGCISQRCRERADDTAIVFIDHAGEHLISYAQFCQRANDYTQALVHLGIQRGELVVLVLPHSAALIYSFWGAILYGAVPSIFPFLSDKLDPARYYDSVRQLIEHEGVKALITNSEFEQGLRDELSGLNIAVINADRLEHSTVTAAEWQPNSSDTAFLQHSSGSTGLQKGVMLSHSAVLNQLNAYGQTLHLTQEDVIVSWLPLYHDMGLIAGFVLPLVTGVKLVLMSPFHWVRDPKILLHAISRHRATLCWLPNFAYNFLATRIRDKDIEGVNLSSMRAFINCSEPVYAESHRQFAARYAGYGLNPTALQTCYAMAENTFAVTQSTLGSIPKVDSIQRPTLMDERRAVPDSGGLSMVSCGTPIPGCEIRVVDEQRQDLPERYVGEIALRSASMMNGYYKRPEDSAQVMAEGWYFTGDMGYIADGELYISGRKKDLIIVGGKNIYPQDIENLLNDISGLHPGRASVFGVFNESLGTEDIAIVAEVDDSVLEDDEARANILREVRARVAQNTDVTARYVHLVGAKWLIKTSSGKVARRANREKYLQEVLNREP